jgi:3-oxoacyl-[acyl-carrier protein] reductase
MDLGIAGKWALVCGASRGLGFGCAQALVNEGVNVLMASRDPAVLQASADSLAERAAQTGAQVLHVAADVTTEAGRAAVFAVRKDFDIVVTNAGGPPTGDALSFGHDDWIRAVEANMLAPIELIRATAAGMAERGFGRIVNITSGSVKAPIDVLALSNGARSGLTGFIAGLARGPLAAKGVTINNLLPGAFDTDRLRVTMQGAVAKTGKSFEEVAAARRQTIPAKRFGNAEEFGAICAFLCSQQAAYLTGQNVLADGGAFPGTF